MRESIDAEPSFAGAKLGAPKASFKNLREENREIKSATPVNEAGLAFSDSTYTFRDGSLDFAKFTGHDAALCTKTGVHLKRRLGEPSKHSTDGSEQSYWRGRHARLVFGSQGNVCTVLLFDDQSLMNKMVAP